MTGLGLGLGDLGFGTGLDNKNRVNLTNVAFTFRFRFILSVYSLVDWKTALIGRDSVLLLTATTEMLVKMHIIMI